MSQPNRLRELIVGVEQTVRIAGGDEVVYTNFDNAASTPALTAAKRAADELLSIYASIHRGAGYKSQLASEFYDRSRDEVMSFVGADPETHCAVLTCNTTDSLNRLARKFPHDDARTVVISHAEHHANDLPWRSRGPVVRVPVSPRGEIDPQELARVLETEAERVRLVSLTGASNVVGTIQPIEELTRVAHEYGVPVCVDAAQLAPHRALSMQLPGGDHIDFLALSGHKMYAPFGGGALIGPREFLEASDPAVRGGGAVTMVDPVAVAWEHAPEREEAGSPNVLGMVALAAAMRQLRKLGFDRLDEEEMRLTRRFLDGLAQIPGSEVYGLSDPADDARRVGVVAFNLAERDHNLVAAALSHHGGIGVRNGCFCAHPYVLQMLGVSEHEAERHKQKLLSGDHRGIPGAVRASFGLYNTDDEVDRSLELLDSIARGKHNDSYRLEGPSGRFVPLDGEPDYSGEVHRIFEEVLDSPPPDTPA